VNMVFRFVWLISLVALTAVTHSAPFPRPERPDPRQFMLMAWDDVRPEPERLAELRDAGINVAGFCSTADLDAVRRAGLHCILKDPTISSYDLLHLPEPAIISQDLARVAARDLRDPIVLGLYLNDEPDTGQLKGIAQVTAQLKAIAPAAQPFVNLFPYREFKVEVYDDYESYTRMLVDEASQPSISFDNYALSYAGLGDDYFNNLEIVRRVALEKNLPFYACIQSVAHFGYLVPNDATLSLQAFTAVAYGARGIEYFTFYTPERGNYRDGPIDPFGRRTSTYGSLQRVNSQIAALAPTLVRLRSTGVYHYPDTPRRGEALVKSRWVKSVSMNKDEDGFVPPSVAARFLVGEFADETARPYVMLVNKDLTYSFQFEIEYREPVRRAWRMNPYTGQEEELEGEQMWISPGGAVLIRLEPSDDAAARYR